MLLTYLNVVSAITGIYLALVQNNIKYAVICLIVSGVCDMLDGSVARTKKNRSESEKHYGIQMDSLADVVSFGVLPSIIGYALLSSQYERVPAWYIAVMSAYALAALIRLSYFNVTEIEMQRNNIERTYYVGLPVTCAAVVIPIVYSACVLFDIENLPLVYSVTLAAMSLSFVVKFKLPKVRIRYIAAVCGLLFFPVMYIIVKS